MAKTIETYKGMPVIEASDSKDLEKKLEKMERIKPPFAVKISRRTKMIKKDAFNSCTYIAAILIPDSVTEIGENAFFGCTGLTSSINIPDSVTNIGDHAFEGCEGLTSINIPDSVTEIGDYAFFGCTGLTSINIPDSVTEIGWCAFKDCI